jgi:hypothetical protein
MVKFGDELIEKQGDAQPSNLKTQPSTVKESTPCQMLSPHSSSQVPEWSSKYIRYEHLAKILSSLPMREQEQHDIEKSITLELEDAAASDSQQRNRSPPRSGSEAFGRVTIEVQSDFSSQKEYGNSAFVVIFVTSCTCIIMRRTSTFCEFRANNMFYCIDHSDTIAEVLKALIERTQTAREEAVGAKGLAKLRAVKEASELKVEAQ